MNSDQTMAGLQDMYGNILVYPESIFSDIDGNTIHCFLTLVNKN
ncbi:hypothetical protein [Spirosoma sp.]|nr:hypothetical protein [Spirosoma sp.]MCX6218564.1 hypothetical protein [Spirosoma sp.]